MQNSKRITFMVCLIKINLKNLIREVQKMEFIDTQIVSYKFKNNRELFDEDIRRKQISSIVALEFLGIMIKNENRARMYPVKLKKFHPIMPFFLEHRKKGFELGKKVQIS